MAFALKMTAAVAKRSAGSLLVVVPPESDGTDPVCPATVVAGLPLVRRVVLVAARAGFGRILVQGLSAKDNALAGTAADPLIPGEFLPPLSRRRIVLIPVNVIPKPDWLRSLLEMPLDEETLYVDASLVAVIESQDPRPILAAAARYTSAGELVAALRGMFDASDRSFDPAGRFPLRSSDDVSHAERWLLRSLVKRGEGVMSRLVERRISLALTRRLVTTRVTPNAMTLLSVSIGLAGAPFFLSSSPAYQLPGALLFLAHSILDGCDGELARLKFLESRGGAILDYWGDNLVHTTVFASIAIGWSLAIHSGWPLFLGGLLIASSLAAAVALFRQTLADEPPDADASAVGRVAERLSHRDFIYLIVLLAAAGRAAWFVALASVGTPIFLLLLWIGRTRRMSGFDREP